MNLEHHTSNNIAFVQLPNKILMADAKAMKKPCTDFCETSIHGWPWT